MKIEVNYNNERSTEHEINKDQILVGRSKDCDIRVIADGISRKHARIYKLGQKVMIEDLGSANGTFINNEKIQKEEFTTFFPVHLGPIISLSLLDEAESLPLKKSSSGKAPSSLNNIDNILNARAKAKISSGGTKTEFFSDKPKREPKKKRVPYKPSLSHLFKIQLALGIALLAGIAYYFYENKPKNLALGDKEKSDFKEVKILPFKEGASCESPIATCADLKLSDKQKEKLLYQNKALIVERNLAYPYRLFADHFDKLSDLEKAKSLALETFLRASLYKGFVYTDKVMEVEIHVFRMNNGKKENIVKLKFLKKKSPFPTPFKAQIWSAMVYRKGMIDEVIERLSPYFEVND